MKAKREFTKPDVLAYIAEHSSLSYPCGELAKIFRVPSPKMRGLLVQLEAEGAICCGSEGSERRYYAKPEPKENGPKFEFRPLVGYDAKMRAIAQSCEKGRG